MRTELGWILRGWKMYITGKKGLKARIKASKDTQSKLQMWKNEKAFYYARHAAFDFEPIMDFLL